MFARGDRAVSTAPSEVDGQVDRVLLSISVTSNRCLHLGFGEACTVPKCMSVEPPELDGLNAVASICVDLMTLVATSDTSKRLFLRVEVTGGP